MAMSMANKNKVSAKNDSGKNQLKPSNDFSNRGNFRDKDFGRKPTFNRAGGHTDYGCDDPEGIGMPFYNPYSFMPFPTKDVERRDVSSLTIDETEKNRFTGVLELKIKTISPLLALDPKSEKIVNKDHKEYNSIVIGNDVILPASSVRGSLHSLMTILTGGSLGFLDTNVWLCQGRDLQLGPTMANKNAPAILARVTKPGNSLRDGEIELGESRLIPESSLDNLTPRLDIKSVRPTVGDKPIFIDDPERPSRWANSKTDECQWQLKLSGSPVNTQGKKREGVFKGNGTQITIPAQLWADYQGRNKFGSRKELKEGDLVWIEPKNGVTTIRSAQDVVSLQWARWGKKGTNLKDCLPKGVIPGCLDPYKDQTVDMIADLWGQVAMEKTDALSFASRIRPHNLIFIDGVNHQTKSVDLAILAQPHPGCISFYRKGEFNKISKNSPLKGYKIYRNSVETGDDAPWLFRNQGTFDKAGLILDDSKQNSNKTVDLLNAGQEGTLKISCRALSKDEMAILLLACSVDWKLGGGKPLGLGHCQATSLKYINEEGDVEFSMNRQNGETQAKLPEQFISCISKELEDRAKLYTEYQKPVNNLRYPRAVGNGIRREGLQWFSRFSTMKKSISIGLQPCHANGKSYKGQILADNPNDCFYGYDSWPVNSDTQGDGKTITEKLVPFNPSKRKASPNKNHGANESQNRDSRRRERSDRKW